MKKVAGNGPQAAPVRRGGGFAAFPPAAGSFLPPLAPWHNTGHGCCGTANDFRLADRWCALRGDTGLDDGRMLRAVRRCGRSAIAGRGLLADSASRDIRSRLRLATRG